MKSQNEILRAKYRQRQQEQQPFTVTRPKKDSGCKSPIKRDWWAMAIVGGLIVAGLAIGPVCYVMVTDIIEWVAK